MSRELLGSSLALMLVGGAAAQSGWTMRAPTTAPPARGYHQIAYDWLRGVTVLFGGWNGSYFGDTWEWNGVNWSQRTPTVSPSPRLSFALAFDVARARVVLFGGAIGSGAGVDDDETWEWDGTNWLLMPAALRPSPRRGANMAYDAWRGVTVLFGGGLTQYGSPVYDDTWVWNGVTWLQAQPAVRPPARWSCILVGDQVRGNVVMFGGGLGATPTTFSDTWTWDGTTWQQRSPATVPTARRNGGGAFDVQRGLVVTFGGLVGGGGDNSTWVWDGVDWRQDARNPRPPSRWAGGVTHDVARNRTVLFGGYAANTFADTWEYELGAMARWNTTGSGCAGTFGTPSLQPLGGALPVLGTTFPLRLTYGASAIAVLAVGVSDQSWSGGALPQSLAPFGMPGCTLFTSTEWLGAVSLPSGSGTVSWALPGSPTFAGWSFFTQGLVIEPGANPLGAIVSNAGAGVVGTF